MTFFLHLNPFFAWILFCTILDIFSCEKGSLTVFIIFRTKQLTFGNKIDLTKAPRLVLNPVRRTTAVTIWFESDRT